MASEKHATQNAGESGDLNELLAEAERVHGHLCAGQILGVRMAMLALYRLGIHEPRKKILANGEPNPTANARSCLWRSIDVRRRDWRSDRRTRGQACLEIAGLGQDGRYVRRP